MNAQFLAGSTVCVVPGDGVVARCNSALLVVPAPAEHQVASSAALLELIQQAEEADSDGRRLFRRVAAILGTTDPDDVPAFTLVHGSERGLSLLVHGNIVAAVDGEARYDGAAALAWVEGLIDQPFDQLQIGPNRIFDESSSLAIPFDLRQGVVPGSAVVVRPRTPVQPDAGASPPLASPGVDSPPAQIDPDETRVTPATEATPSEVTPASGTAATGVAPVHLVEGVLCARGHFNDPLSAFCTRCGGAMEPHTKQTVMRPRPPLGLLMLDDGSAHALDTDYIVGREPQIHEAVRSAAARPLVIDDEVSGVSRVHAAITVQDWAVQLTDLRSANGTYVRDGEGSWTRLTPEEPVVVGAGARVRIGQRNLIIREDPG